MKNLLATLSAICISFTAFISPAYSEVREVILTINGRGFFEVFLKDGGSAFTRNGHFKVDVESRALVTDSGALVSPGIFVPEGTTKIKVSRGGWVRARFPGSPQMTILGQLAAIRFTRSRELQKFRRWILRETTLSGIPLAGLFNADGFGHLTQAK